jgi:cytochrome c biogenesis factor
VWLAALIMAIGGFVAASDRRYHGAKVAVPGAEVAVPEKA